MYRCTDGGSWLWRSRDQTGQAERVGLLRQLWQDDCGAVLASEWVLLMTIFLVGIVPALIALRQGLLTKMLDLSTATLELDESYGFTGTAIEDVPDRDSRSSHAARPLGERAGNPVLAEAARVSWPYGDRHYNRADDHRHHRARVHAFTAGSLFVEDRHLDGRGRLPVISAHAVPAD